MKVEVLKRISGEREPIKVESARDEVMGRYG
jgi:hypothetical protein